MPTSLFIVGLLPEDSVHPATAPWGPSTAARRKAVQLGFEEQFFVHGLCDYLYDNVLIRRRDVGHEIGCRSAQVMLAATRHNPTVFVLFGEVTGYIFQKELNIPRQREPFASISVTERLHILTLPDPLEATAVIRDDVKRQLYVEASDFLVDVLGEDLGTTAVAA